ncbi:MAG: tetratricopeptide repeat protein [Myxococcota bacterium]
MQSSAEAPPQGWVDVGHAWVRKARESFDPVYYLHANAAADVALSLDPKHRDAMNLKGLVLLNDHKFTDARDMARHVLSLDPDNPVALGTLSDALMELGDFQGAAEAAQKMMDLKPNLPAYSRASYMRWLQGDVGAAIILARQAIDAAGKAGEQAAWVLSDAAMLFWHKGDYAGADAGFDMALTQFVDHPYPLAGRARVAMAKGDYARAAQFAEKAYQKQPTAEHAWLLGDAHAAAGDEARAKEAYAEVVKHGKAGDKRTLALFYATQNHDIEEALRLITDELKSRGDIYTHDAHAWVLYRAGKFPEAKAAVEKALQHGTQDARLLFHAGAIHLASGEKEKGRKLLQDALKLNPRFDWTGAREAEQLLAAK